MTPITIWSEMSKEASDVKDCMASCEVRSIVKQDNDNDVWEGD